jgi:putative membrane protein
MMWNGPYGMMGDWGGWGWFGPFHFIFPLLFLALIITAIVMAVRYAIGWDGYPMRPGMMGPGMERRPLGLDILEERYARGEINRDEYLQKKRDILG